jgi:archaetidylinositol phosphate synthase
MEKAPEQFNGDKKVDKSLIHSLEQKFIKWAVPRVPKFIEGYHLTLLSFPISAGIILFSYLALGNIHWLWLVSLMIALQWLTDSLDGAVGRARDFGTVRWGYYMDHLLDYFFLAAIMTGYMILLPDYSKLLFFYIFILFSGFMVNAYLTMATSNKFRVAHLGIGPTEVRLAFILINTLIIVFGRTHLVFALPYVLGFASLGLIVVIFKESREIWQIDMENKKMGKK